MDVTQTATREPEPSLVTTTHLTYALHALGLASGAFGASTVIGAFVFGWPSIIAVIINYVKRSDARGTWLESHFDWQIRTFWYALAWSCLIGILGFVFLIVLVGIAIWIVGFFILGDKLFLGPIEQSILCVADRSGAAVSPRAAQARQCARGGRGPRDTRDARPGPGGARAHRLSPVVPRTGPAHRHFGADRAG